MKKLHALFALGVLVLAGTGLPADEPHREFVQGLRERHFSDLALQYLEKLQKNQTPDMAKWLALEMAKTHMELAREQPDAGKRAELFAKARDEFAAFIKGNPEDPRVPEANLELARSVVQQGKVQLAESRHQDEAATRRAEAEKARKLFEDAGVQLKQASDQIGNQLKKYENPATDAEKDAKRELSEAKVQAELEQGLNLLDQALTYDETTDVEKRGAMVKKAQEALKKLAGSDENNPISWVARAWAARCYQEIDQAKDALKEYQAIIAEKGSAADTGRRLAQYFRLLVIDKDAKVKDPPTDIAKEAERWLEIYPSYVNTPEGIGVRWQLAEAYKDQGLRIPKAQQSGRIAQDLYAKAEKLYGELEATENDYTQQARERKLNIIITRSGERTRGDISKLKNFQECYLRAQAEIGRMGEEERKEGKLPAEAKKRQQQRQEHFQNIIAALMRALDLADGKTPAQDLNDARFVLGYAYLSSGDPFRAALVSENLARTAARSNRAPTAAGYALQAYSQLIGDEERGGNRPGYLKADRDRLRALAQYMEKAWPTHPATDLARHQLGLMAMREENYPEAVAVLGRISPSYHAIIISQFQLAKAAEAAGKAQPNPAAGQPSYAELAAAALAKIPELPATADTTTSEIYVYARLDLAATYFRQKKYKEMKALAEDLLKRFPTIKLDDETRTKVQPGVDALPLYVTYGLATEHFRNGNLAEVRKLVDPIAAQARDNKLPQGVDLKLLRAVLGMDLQATVQEGKIKEAKELLELLQKTASSLEGGATGILVELVEQLRGRIEELRQRGDGAKPELEKTVASYTAFLDELAKQPGPQLKPELVRFLAFSYAVVDKHGKAVELLSHIPKPVPSTNTDAEKKTKEDQDNDVFYRSVRVLLAHEARLDKQYKVAEDVLKQLMSTEQGKRSVEPKKEHNLLLEDQALYGPAFTGWDALMKMLKPRLNDNKYRDLYYDCYYHLVFCYLQHSLKIPDEGKKRNGVKKAAGFIVKLEGSKPDMGGEALQKRYKDLIEKEPLLKEAYEELKKPAQ